MQEGVVLLHGIFRTHRSMEGLARHLRKDGFNVLNLGYPSTKHSIDVLAIQLHSRIDSFGKECSRLHFVGYSMGGLLIRAYLKTHPISHVGRVVMLGTPNHGSEVADFIGSWWLYRWLYGPAGQQLGTKTFPLACLHDALPCELGVLAGSRSLDPISSYIIGVPSDGKVSIESTKLAGMKEHKVIKATHTFFPHNRDAWKETAHFLKNGHFIDGKPQKN